MSPYKRHHAIEARIEHLGQLNDRRLSANERRDIIELAQIADEYEGLKHPCGQIAREIRITISLFEQYERNKEHETETDKNITSDVFNPE